MKTLHIAGCGTDCIWQNDNLIAGRGKTRGGAAFYRNQCGFDIADGIYLLNHVQMDGGCIYLLDCHNVTIIGNLFIFNKAKWGGAIYLERCTNTVISDNRFLFNFAVRDGGAISLSQCNDIIINGNFFAFNSALRSEGKIDIHNCSKVKIIP